MEMIFPDSPGQWVALLLLSILTLLIIPLGGGGSGGSYKAPPPKGLKPDILPPGWDEKQKK